MYWSDLVNPVRFLSLAAIFLFAGAVQAQTISGTVRSANGPVVGATVRLLELERVEHTGAQGEYSFSGVPRGVYRVFVGVTGYASATHTVTLTGDAETASFDLTESAIRLQQVIVSA